MHGMSELHKTMRKPRQTLRLESTHLEKRTFVPFAFFLQIFVIFGEVLTHHRHPTQSRLLLQMRAVTLLLI